MPNALIVIPARMASTRFPKKPLAKLCGMAMCERVWRIGKAVEGADTILATDDLELARYAESFGAHVAITHVSHATGTDRVAEVARANPSFDILFSLQGDAPLTPPWVIEELLGQMLADPTIQIATPAVKLKGSSRTAFIQSKKEGSTTGTCVVMDQDRNALYFSKALIPFSRDGSGDLYRHIGLYAYRREALIKLTTLPQSPLEKVEKLEQLRALENGIPIRVVCVDYKGRTHGSVDRPEDIPLVEAIIQREGELV